MQTINIENIGKLVRDRRKKMRLTQQHAAALCNVGTRFFSELENGKTTLEIGKVFSVLNNLGLNIEITERHI